MSLIEQFREKVQTYEGYTDAWIVRKKIAIVTHAITFILGGIVTLYLKFKGIL